MTATPLQKIVAEALGTALLLVVVIGSGVMAERLAGGNTAIALLANTLATAGGLYVLIEVFGPISGAHFRETIISFEWEPPDAEEMRARIDSTRTVYPWLVSVDDAGTVNGYASAGKHRDAASYQWSVNVSAYARADPRGRGIGKRLYAALLQRLVALGKRPFETRACPRSKPHANAARPLPHRSRSESGCRREMKTGSGDHSCRTSMIERNGCSVMRLPGA